MFPMEFQDCGQASITTTRVRIHCSAQVIAINSIQKYTNIKRFLYVLTSHMLRKWFMTLRFKYTSLNMLAFHYNARARHVQSRPQHAGLRIWHAYSDISKKQRLTTKHQSLIEAPDLNARLFPRRHIRSPRLKQRRHAFQFQSIRVLERLAACLLL